MNQADYLKHDAVGLAGLIAGREVSAAEVLEAAITRMEAVNPEVNAVVLDLTDEARAQVKAGTSAGPLGGVPYLIKDLVHMRGVVTTSGSRLYKDRVAEADNASARLYRQAGLVLFGKTNTPEFGLEPVTEPELFGPSRNPWDLERTPGGSSGGASAAVAAGIVPAANASDGGGSIRTPASCCGLFGLKPSRGRSSYAPGNEGWGGFSVNHAVTRTVRDSAALLDAICAPQVGDPYYAPPPERPFAEEVRRGPGRLRIALFDGAIIGGDIDPECAEAVRETGRLLQSLGHEVTEAALPGDIQPTRAASGTIISASVAADLDAEAARLGRPVELGEIDAVSMSLYQRGRTVGGAEYVQALRTVHAWGRVACSLWNDYDVFLCSTLGSLPIRIGELRGDPLDLAGYGPRLFGFMPNTQAANWTGQPAMTVPLAWSQSGLPIGVQFMGAQGDEATLLRLAAQLEQARPWKDRWPAAFAP